MYQRSRKILIFLGVIFLGIQITFTVIVIIVSRAISGGKLSVLSLLIEHLRLMNEYKRSISSPATMCVFTVQLKTSQFRSR